VIQRAKLRIDIRKSQVSACALYRFGFRQQTVAP